MQKSRMVFAHHYVLPQIIGSEMDLGRRMPHNIYLWCSFCLCGGAKKMPRHFPHVASVSLCPCALCVHRNPRRWTSPGGIGHCWEGTEGLRAVNNCINICSVSFDSECATVRGYFVGLLSH